MQGVLAPTFDKLTITREIKIHVYAKRGRREILPRDQVFPLFSVYSLLFLHKNKLFYGSFNNRNRSGQFLSAYFLFWEILNLSLTFAVCGKRES